MSTIPQGLPEIAAADATGEIRLIYDAIEAALGVRLVNLVYRHLATYPGALEWAWGTVGAPFADGVFAAEARSLLALVDAGAGETGTVSLGGAGLDGREADAVVATIAAYNRANPMNAVSLQVVALALAAGRPAAPPPLAGSGGADLPHLLPITPLENLPQGTLDQLGVLARLATGGRSPIVPSLFRHLTAWPRLLLALADWLEPIAAEGTVDKLSAQIHEAAAGAAANVFGDLPPPGAGAYVPDDATRAALRQTIAVFPPAICRMIVLGRLLAAALRP